MPQLSTNNMLGLGGPAGTPDRGPASTHTDRARSANPAEKRQASRSGGADDRAVGFRQALKDQLGEQREPGRDAVASQGEDLPEGGKASPPSADAAGGMSALTMVATTELMPAPVPPHAALDTARIANVLSAGEDRIGSGTERGSQRGLIAMLQRHAGAGTSDAMPPALRALANALATTSGKTDVASFAATTEGGGIASAQPQGAQPSAAAPTATPTSPALLLAPGDPARTPVVIDMDQPVGQPAWRDAVGHHVTWMADQGIGRAELRLHPAHLGPIEVRVSVQNDQVNVSFHASHAATREALESSLPRLRELLGDSGLSLGQASVSQQFAGGERAPERSTSSERAGELHLDHPTGQIEAPTTTRVRVGLLDAYA